MRINEVSHGELPVLYIPGASLIFTYAGERFEKGVRELAGTLERKNSIVLPCDVTSDDDSENMLRKIKDEVSVIHGLAHCIAFAIKKNYKENI